MTTKRILFVDDEPNVLQGLRRMLRTLRDQWQFEFAAGGPQALDCLAAAPCDVVLTDMRMPGMDGAELLHAVMQRHPTTVRIVLSGQCDRHTVLKCVGPAHQFLTKPCDADTLKATVGRACSLCDALAGSPHKGTLSRVTAVPSPPGLHDELVAELTSASASLRRVTEIMARDVGMTAKLLQLVSTSFFGSPQRVPHAAAAIRLLGLDTLKPLALTAGVWERCDLVCVDDGWLGRTLDHSLAVACAAEAIARLETADPVLVGDAFLGGLLHEVGALALASSCPPDSRQVPAGDAAEWQADQLAAEASAYLMALWGLPPPIVTAIALQPSPVRSTDQAFTALTAVHVAHACLRAECAGGGAGPGAVDAAYLQRIGCAARLDLWRDACLSAPRERVCP